MMEIVYAKMWRKRVFIFGEAYRDSYWIRYHANRFFRDLDEAIEAIVKEKE